MSTDDVAAYARIGFSLDRGRPLRPRGEGLYSVSYTHSLTHSHTERPSWDVALSLRIYSLSQYICRRSLFSDADESSEFRHKSQAILFISIVALWHHSVFVLPIRRPGPTDRPTEQETDFD